MLLFNLFRYQIASAQTIADEVKNSWKPPKVGIVHWDGKLMETLDNKYGVEERLPVLLSGVIFSCTDYRMNSYQKCLSIIIRLCTVTFSVS